MTPTPSASAQPSDPALLADAGQPFDTESILSAMRTSPRPDGVPAELQTDAIASSIAGAIWTFDGAAWDTIVVSASCAATCTVEVAGSRDGTAGDDLWVFEVDPASESVEVGSTELRAVPTETVQAIDRLGRAVGASVTDDMLLATVAWQPPPDDDRFRLSYRSGGEEGSCAVDLLVDARAGTLVDEIPSGC